MRRKGGQGEVGWYVHPKGENSMAVSGFGCKTLNTVISPTLSANGPRKQSSYLIKASMQCSSLIYWLELVSILSNLITNVLECHLVHCQEQETGMYRVWLGAEHA